MLFDLHVHTEVSVDSDMKLDEAIAKAGRLGMGITITDHMDLNDYRPNAFTFDVDAYFKKYGPFRSDRVLLGIELGFRQEAYQRNLEMVHSYPFDFVLGSTHAPYATKDHLEYYDYEHYDGKTKQETYEAYFATMLKGIQENPYFDSLAHIDYIARYAPFKDTEIYYHEFGDAIDAVLKELAVMDKSLEIGTRRFNDLKAVEELVKIYKRFKELGGRSVTLGSDSHTPEYLGYHFKQASEIAEGCGLKIVYYKERMRMNF